MTTQHISQWIKYLFSLYSTFGYDFFSQVQVCHSNWWYQKSPGNEKTNGSEYPMSPDLLGYAGDARSLV